MILNLDPTFKPFQGEELEFESFIFSGGEPHIRILSAIQTDQITITHRLHSFNDLGILLVAIDALRRAGIKKIKLILPYFPAARQDRVMVVGEALTVKVYAEIINALDLEELIIFDPHSEVTPALLNNCTVINNHGFIQAIISDLSKDLLLISPDGGALKKIHKLAQQLKNYDVLACGKTRNVETGALSGFTVPAENLAGRPCLIVDDICDGGGTFMGLAQELKKKNAGELYLAVSHGIFSRGTDELNKHYEKIYTTDSFKHEESEKLITVKLGALLEGK